MKKQLLLLALAVSTGLTFPVMADYDRETIQNVQQALNDAGFDCGTPDGIIGGNTHSAIEAWQEANNMDVTGEISDELCSELGITVERQEDTSSASSMDIVFVPEKTVLDFSYDPDTFVPAKGGEGPVLLEETDNTLDQPVRMQKTYYHHSDDSSDIIIDTLYLYDENGNVLLETDLPYGVSDKYVQELELTAQSFRFTYTGMTYEECIDLAAESLGVRLQTTAYAYDNEGNCVVEATYVYFPVTARFVLCEYSISEWDGKGCLLKRTEYEKRGSGAEAEPELTVETVCTYDDDGNILTETEDNNSLYGSGHYEYSYEYDKDGVLTREEYIKDEDTPRITEYFYDADGLLTKEVSTEDDTVWREIDYQYASDGQMTDKYLTFDDGRSYEFLYSYNSNGGLTEEQHIKDGELEETSKYEYDAKGRLIKKTELDADGQSDTSEEYFY